MKRDLITVIEALNYYRNNLANINVENFEDTITNLDYDETEKII
jgi:hypothetical protein